MLKCDDKGPLASLRNGNKLFNVTQCISLSDGASYVRHMNSLLQQTVA